MRWHTCPHELGVAFGSLGGGWATAGAPGISTSGPRKDSSGGGGARYVTVWGSAQAVSPPRPATREAFARMGMGRTAGLSSARVLLQSSDSSIAVEYQADGDVALLRNGTVLETGGLSTSAGQWFTVQAHVYLHDSAGFGVVEVDGATVIDYDGDTLGGSDPDCTKVAITAGATSATGINGWVDDLVVNVPSLAYAEGTGDAPVAGEVLTGAGGGQVTVASVLDGSDETAGRVIVYGWNGTPFTDGEVLTGSSGLVAEVHAPTLDYVDGLEPNSSWPKNGHVVLLMPNGNGTYSQLTGSDGNSTDNYLLVNAVPPNAATYVQGDADGEQDTYEVGSLPASAAHVNAITAVGIMQSDLLGLDYRQMLLVYDSTEAESHVAALASGAQLEEHTWDSAPDGSGYLTTALVDAIEVGVRFVT